MNYLLKITLLISLLTPGLAVADTLSEVPPQVVSYVEYEVTAPNVASLQVTTLDVSLNVYEATLSFNPLEIQVDDILVESELCESRFVIEKSINNELGEVYVACGTTNPFDSEGEFAPVMKLLFTRLVPVVETPLTIGAKTSFYINDGKGTLASRAELQKKAVE